MNLLHYNKVLISLICILSPLSLYASSELEELEKTWDEKRYEILIPELIKYRDNDLHLGIMQRIDYMLGTSMCRVSKYQTKGLKFLTMIPFSYRHISEYNTVLIDNEIDKCKINHKILRLSYQPPGVYGKGAIHLSLRDDIPSEVIKSAEKKFIEKAREYNSRIFKIKEELPLNVVSKMKAFTGDDYNVVINGHFIIVGNKSEPELDKTGKDLEKTLTLLLRQFKLEAPEYFTTVYLIPTAEKMVEFASNTHEIKIPSSMWGYTFPYDSSIVIRESGGMGTVGHEIIHTLFNYNFPEAPPWLNEGYSALFEEYLRKDDRLIGTYRNDHWRIKDEYLHKNPRKRPSIAELITMDWRSFDTPNTEGWHTKEMHTNHTTAKFFAMYLQNKQKKLEQVFHAFRNKDFKTGSEEIVIKYKKLLEETLGNTSIEKIEKDFQQWIDNELPEE